MNRTDFVNKKYVSRHSDRTVYTISNIDEENDENLIVEWTSPLNSSRIVWNSKSMRCIKAKIDSGQWSEL